jgi:hypothetical protein
MDIVIRALESAARHLLGAAVALRGFRGNPYDAHALAHHAVVQAVIDPEECDGVCTCDLVVDVLERRRMKVN